jgi:SAM-dependent methyltransferase
VERPGYLNEENAERFGTISVAEAYGFRLPYPPALFDLLESLVVDEPRAVLDIGAGTGDIARELAGRGLRVDAVDMSAAMVARGRALPGGERPGLTWIVGKSEEAPLSPPYALVTAGESLHWMDWERVLPRIGRSLTPSGSLALVGRNELPPPWQDGLMDLISRYSTLKRYREFNLVEALESAGLFTVTDSVTLDAVSHDQPVEDYIASFFSRSSLTREALGVGAADAFAHELRQLVRPHAVLEVVSLQLAPRVTFGRPAA